MMRKVWIEAALNGPCALLEEAAPGAPQMTAGLGVDIHFGRRHRPRALAERA
jgi:hypothetical protein